MMDDIDKPTPAVPLLLRLGTFATCSKNFILAVLILSYFFILDVDDVDKATPHCAHFAAAERALLQHFSDLLQLLQLYDPVMSSYFRF